MEEYRTREEEEEASMIDLRTEYEYKPPVPKGWEVIRERAETSGSERLGDNYYKHKPKGWKNLKGLSPIKSTLFDSNRNLEKKTVALKTHLVV